MSNNLKHNKNVLRKNAIPLTNRIEYTIYTILHITYIILHICECRDEKLSGVHLRTRQNIWRAKADTREKKETIFGRVCSLFLNILSALVWTT